MDEKVKNDMTEMIQNFQSQIAHLTKERKQHKALQLQLTKKKQENQKLIEENQKLKSKNQKLTAEVKLVKDHQRGNPEIVEQPLREQIRLKTEVDSLRVKLSQHDKL